MNLSSGQCQPTSLSRVPIASKPVVIYPNPSCGEINIQLDEVPDQLIVFNSLGQIVLMAEDTPRLDLSELGNGIYHLLVSASEIWYRQRVSIQCNY